MVQAEDVRAHQREVLQVREYLIPSVHFFNPFYSYEGVPGKHIDITRNVIDLLGVHWAADQLVRDILDMSDTP